MVRDNGGEGDLSGQDRCCLIAHLGVFRASGCSFQGWSAISFSIPSSLACHVKDAGSHGRSG